MAARPTTRREFLRQAALAAGGVAAGGAVLDACAGRPMPSRAGPAVPIATTSTSAEVPHDQLATAQTPSGLLRIRNRPGMIGADTVRDYQLATGVTVDYYEDVLDDELWLTSERQALANRDDIGVDLVMLGDRAVRELLSAHRLETLDHDNIPDQSHLRDELAHPGFDPGRTHSLPVDRGHGRHRVQHEAGGPTRARGR